MGKVVTFENFDITGDFNVGLYTLMKYPYMYIIQQNHLYRVNVILRTSELVYTLPFSAVGTDRGSGCYCRDTEYLYFFRAISTHLWLYKIDVVTFEYSQLIEIDFIDKASSLNPYYNNVSGRITVVDDTHIQLMYVRRGTYTSSGTSVQVMRYRVMTINTVNNSYTQDFEQSGSSPSGYANMFVVPYILDGSYKRLVYGNESNYYQSYTGYLLYGGQPNPYGRTVGEKSYKAVTVFPFDGYFYAVGGEVGGESNTDIIRIDPNALTSTVIGTSGNDNTSQPAVQIYGDNAYIILSNTRMVIMSIENYDLSYNFVDTNGNILASVVDALPIKSVTLGYADNTVSAKLTYIDNTSYTVNYDLPAVPGYVFAGLSTVAHAYRPQIVPGDNTISIASDTTFYPVYRRHVTPATTFDIDLYNNSAEINRVDKTEYLSAVGTLSGALREECSMVEPVITFQMTDPPMFNYVRIVAFGRWYFVTGITSVSKNVWRMSLSCDVLMTYRAQIWNLTATIARQENDYNPLLQDSELPAQANQVVTVQEFPAGEFKTDESIQYPFVLTVVGA